MTDEIGTKSIIEAVLQVFPQVRRIVLFGSRARRSAAPDSDWDLLVVTPSDLAPAARGARLRLALVGSKVSSHLVVVTPEEYDRLRSWSSSVVARAVEEGESLYEAA